MNLRCKPGDLAYLTSGQWVGYVVEVVRFVGNQPMTGRTGSYEGMGENVWHIKCAAIERDFPKMAGFVLSAPDEILQPIRPGNVTKEVTEELTCGI